MRAGRLFPLAVLLAALAAAWSPHAARLPWWLTPVLAALLVLRFVISWLGLAMPNRMWLLPPAAAAALWAVISFRPFFGGTGAIALLTVMAALKIFETHERRDWTILALLGYVLTATRFLYTQSPLSGVWMLLLVAVFTYLLYENEDETGERPARFKFLEGLRLIGSALPVALLLFLVFPRTGSPVFSLRGRTAAVTGLSEQLSPGSVSQLTVSEEIAFRARFTDPDFSGAALYWRGPTFDAFDGKTWRSSKSEEGPPKLAGYRATVAQELQAEEGASRWLTPLDLPLTADNGLKAALDGTMRAQNGFLPGGTYRASSILEPRYLPLSGEERTRFTALPAGLGDRVIALGKSFAAGATGDAEILSRAQGFFSGGEFLYSLEPPLLGEKPVEQFLFDTRRGFCEHYASALAVLLRAAGVPARVVTGYLGGEYNPYGGHWIVQQRHAHAWTEAWVEPLGWTRADPTALVSPERMAGSIDYAASLSAGAVRYALPASGLFSGFRFAGDYLGYWYNEWVLGFGPARQRELMERLGLGPLWGLTVFGALCVVGPLGWVGTLYLAGVLRERRKRDPAEAAWLIFCGKLEKGGLSRLPHEPPLGFAARAAQFLPAQADKVEEVAALYVRVRYGPRPSEGDMAHLRELAAAFTLLRKDKPGEKG